jgi:hypothetical protein
MENIFIYETATFANRTKTVDQIITESVALYNPATDTLTPHPIAVDILKNAVGSEFEIFNSGTEYDKIEILNNLIIHTEITDPVHLTRIIKFDGTDYAYIHHLIGRGFHETLNAL